MVILDLPFKTRYRGLVKLTPAVSVCTPRISRSSETPVVARGRQRARSPHPNTLLFRAPGNTVSGLPHSAGQPAAAKPTVGLNLDLDLSPSSSRFRADSGIRLAGARRENRAGWCHGSRD